MSIKINTISDLISLSAATDKRQLSSSLLKIINSLDPGRGCRIFALGNDQGGHEFNETNAAHAYCVDINNKQEKHLSLSSRSELLQCVLTQQPVKSNDNRKFFPAVKKHGISHILEISGNELSPDEEVHIIACWQMWSNLYHILDAGERDKLTELFNRTAFEKRIPIIFETPSPHDMRSSTVPDKSIAIIDIDYFKKVNDDFGHLYGDEVIVQACRIMTKSVRQHDYLFRYGGEEFIVVLNDCPANMAIKVMERFRKNIEDYIFPGIGQLTISVGIADIRGGQLPSTILDQADRALYYAKSHGRNQVQHYRELIENNKLTETPTSAEDVELF